MIVDFSEIFDEEISREDVVLMNRMGAFDVESASLVEELVDATDLENSIPF
jgi:hypothetical protein